MGLFIGGGRLLRGAFQLARTALVGTAPQPGGPQPISATHPLAKYNKLIAVPVGAVLGWAATATGWDFLIEYQAEATAFIIGYLVWRLPNALPQGR